MPESVVPCCPPLEVDKVCDTLDFQYRQIHNAPVQVGDRTQLIPVEVILRVRLQRCSGPLALGDLVYSTTLLPGEKVRLFTTDRRSRFTYDSSTKLSYRNEQTQEEHFYMSSMADFMSDVSARDSGRSSNQSKGHTDTHAETSGFLSSIFGSPSVDVNGNYNAEATSDFLRELSQHAQASSHRAELGVRGASAVSVGEVQSRTHAEGESEDHFEASSRQFSNPNRCHALTFYFYRINKTQTIRFTLEAIERRVIDPAVGTKVTNNPFASRGDVSVIPSAVLATAENRLKVEEIGRSSVAAEQRASQPSGLVSVASATAVVGVSVGSGLVGAIPEPIPEPIRRQALQHVDAELVKSRLIGAIGGQVSPEAQKQYSFELRSSLPTPGLMVKGCLDECNTCEPALQQQIKLELERKQLENQLLQRQIDLLEKSQEYRCCPNGVEKTA
jgi:hypothetical protein